MLDFDPASDPTSCRPGDGVTTVKEAAKSVEQAYDKSTDTLDDLLELSSVLKIDQHCGKKQALVTMEKKIEHMKSILEAESLRFFCMTKAIRSSDKVEKLRSWRDMLQQDHHLAVLKGDQVIAAQVQQTNVALTRMVVHQYGLVDLWRQLEERELLEAQAERAEMQRAQRRR